MNNPTDQAPTRPSASRIIQPFRGGNMIAGNPQDPGWVWLTPIMAIIVFAAVMVVSFILLTREELSQRRLSVIRDLEWVQQTLRLDMKSNEERVISLAREIGLESINEAVFASQARTLLSENPEIVEIAWLDANRETRWSVISHSGAPSRAPVNEISSESGLPAIGATEGNNGHRSVYSAPFISPTGEAFFELHAPIFRQRKYLGTVSAVYSINRILTQVLPRELAGREVFFVVDADSRVLASSSRTELVQYPPAPDSARAPNHRVVMDPPGQNLYIEAHSLGTTGRLSQKLTWILVVGLSGLIVWSLLMLARYSKRRARAEFERDKLFSLSMNVLCVMDAEGRFLRANPAFTRVLGVSLEALQGQALMNFIHPDDQTLVQRHLDAFAGGHVGPSGVGFEVRCRQGLHDTLPQWRWLAWGINADTSFNAAQLHLYAVAHDITERKNAEAALAAETAFRRAMEDSVSTGMRAIDMSGRITYVNPAFCRMIGWDESELIGRTAPFPYWPPQYAGDLDAVLESVLEGKSPAGGYEVRIQRRDGSLFDARMYVSPLIDLRGHQTGWMTSMTDITEPKRIREELASAHERFKTVLGALEAAVAVAKYTPGDSPNADLLFANRYYREYFGEGSDGFVELVSAEQARIARADASSTDHEIWADSTSRWFDVRTRRIEWVDGREVQLLIATDITRRKVIEAQQLQQQERLQHTSRLVTMGEMASSLAHELNQPLTAISNYSMGTAARVKALLRKGQSIDPNDLVEALGKTAAQAERAGQVIKRIREFARRSEPKRQKTLVERLLADAIALVESEAVRRKVSIHLAIDDGLPALDVDPILISQVLLNLIKNGIDAQAPLGGGEIRVTVKLEPHPEHVLQLEGPDSAIRFTVADHGPGIAPEKVQRLFEPFFTTKSEGMGIGLNICRSIIEFHHGRLWYEPNTERGAAFVVVLPITDQQSTRPPEQDAASMARLTNTLFTEEQHG